MNTSLQRTQGGRPAFRAARDGTRSMAPWLVGIAPLGLVIGVTTARADSPACAGSLAGPLIFSASAQAVAIQLLDRHAAALVVVAGGLSVNLRLLLYSSAMAPTGGRTSSRDRRGAANTLAPCRTHREPARTVDRHGALTRT